MSQIDLHNRIDQLIENGVKSIKLDDVRSVVNFNDDALAYFYYRADETWIYWLWENAFLDTVKQSSNDPVQFSYRSPELHYLAKVSEKAPGAVVDIMQQVAELDQFNPEVLSRFLDICTKLPARELSRIIPVICEKRWLERMAPFDRWGFGCEEMLKTLAGSGDTQSLLTLAEGMLAVRSKEDLDKAEAYSFESPFFLKNLSDTGVFEQLSSLDSSHLEQVLKLVTKTLALIANLGPSEDAAPFSGRDRFGFYDIDFFTITLLEARRGSYREDLKDLGALAAEIARRTIGNLCNEPTVAERLYGSYIDLLPDTLVMWRYRFFVFSLCPTVSKQRLEEALFRVFDPEGIAFAQGAEYKKALRQGFTQFSPEKQVDYIERIFTTFASNTDYRLAALRLLSSLPKEQLTDSLKKRSREVFEEEPREDYKPEPVMGHVRGGAVAAQAPSDGDNVWAGPLAAIVQKLKTDWSPSDVVKLDTRQDFLQPINAEGVGGRLQSEIKKRPSDYLAAAQHFFDEKQLDAHYTYSFLRGIDNLLNEKTIQPDTNWNPLFALLDDIRTAGEQTLLPSGKFEREFKHGWLATWDSVHSVVGDVLELMLGRNADSPVVPFEEYRDRILVIIKFLLLHPDPEPKAPADEGWDRDLHIAAINSVRGRAYDALMLFLYADGKDFTKAEPIKIKDDVQQLLESTMLKEKAAPMLFLFGRNLATLYFRNHDWTLKTITPHIFGTKDTYRFLAAWEGYLSNNIFLDLFKELQASYERAISLKPDQYPVRERGNGPDESLATHLALAFVHSEDFDLESDLLEAFWSTPNPTRHAEFTEFIGRHVFSRDEAAQWVKENKIDISKLEKFWDWALDQNFDIKAYEGFGFWIKEGSPLLRVEKLAMNVDETLEKTGGELEWNHGLIESLPAFTEAAPVITISILRRFLLESSMLQNRTSFAGYSTDLVAVFRTLYQNTRTKEATVELINDLIEKGSSSFWDLKQVIEDPK